MEQEEVKQVEDQLCASEGCWNMLDMVGGHIARYHNRELGAF